MFRMVTIEFNRFLILGVALKNLESEVVHFQTTVDISELYSESQTGIRALNDSVADASVPPYNRYRPTKSRAQLHNDAGVEHIGRISKI